VFIVLASAALQLHTYGVDTKYQLLAPSEISVKPGQFLFNYLLRRRRNNEPAGPPIRDHRQTLVLGRECLPGRAAL
jgi:hypothetical protein